MKKFLFVLFVFICETFSVNAKEYRLNIKEENETLEPVVLKKKVASRGSFELMEPVKLINPLHKQLGLEAGGPKYTSFKSVKKNVEVAKPLVVVEEKKEDVKVVDVVEKPVDKTLEVKVVEEKKEDKKELVELSQTDKNIDEAKKLLAVAEKLANSVIEENLDDAPVKTENNKIVEPKFEKAVNDISVLNMDAVKKPEFVLTFAKDSENLKKVDEKKLLGMVPMLVANPDMTLKVVSYYSASGNRNLAFSRLLNTRKILLEKEVPTSQIMIMVLEDEEKNNPKKDTIEVFLISAV